MYKKYLMVASMIAVAALTGSLTQAREDAGTGSIKGTVMTSKNVAAKSCVIQFFSKPDYGGGPGGGAGSNGGKGGKGKSTDLGIASGHDVIELQGKGVPIATTKTDDQGNFELKTIKTGTFSYIAGNRVLGMAGGKVTVEAGKAAELKITLNEPK